MSWLQKLLPPRIKSTPGERRSRPRSTAMPQKTRGTAAGSTRHTRSVITPMPPRPGCRW